MLYGLPVRRLHTLCILPTVTPYGNGMIPFTLLVFGITRFFYALRRKIFGLAAFICHTHGLLSYISAHFIIHLAADNNWIILVLIQQKSFNSVILLVLILLLTYFNNQLCQINFLHGRKLGVFWIP